MDIYMHVCWTTTLVHADISLPVNVIWSVNLKGCVWPDEDTACTRLKNIALCVFRLMWATGQTVFLSKETGSEDCGYSRILHSPENGMNRCDCIGWKWSSKGQGYFMSLLALCPWNLDKRRNERRSGVKYKRLNTFQTVWRSPLRSANATVSLITEWFLQQTSHYLLQLRSHTHTQPISRFYTACRVVEVIWYKVI